MVPAAYVKWRTMMYEIAEQKPTLSMDEGVFYDGQIFGASLKDLGKKLFAFSRMEMAAEEVLP